MQPSHLFLGSSRLSSARGIQQGDPLGPLLFALAIHDAVVKSKAAAEQRFPGKLDFVVFYLDDGTIAGEAEAVSFFCATFKGHMADVGL